jgi:hypothetical protein
MKTIKLIFICLLGYVANAQDLKAIPDHRIPTKQLTPIKIPLKSEDALLAIRNPQLVKIKKLVSFLNSQKMPLDNLKLMGSYSNGTRHVLQSPTGKTISMNLETGDAELMSRSELKKVVGLLPSKGNSTIPIYKLSGITDTGFWLYENENGKDVIAESGVSQKQQKPKGEVKFNLKLEGAKLLK